MMKNEEFKMHADCKGCGSSSNPRDGMRAGMTFGGALIIMGAGFLLHRMGMLAGLEAWQVWPAILIWMALLKIFVGRTARHVFEAFVVAGIGAAVFASYLGYFALEWGMIWPAGLIIIGLAIAFSAMRSSRRRSKRRASTESWLSGEVTFGGREERVESQALEGGDIQCTMGGYNLDLRGAALKDNAATIHAKVVMGGVEIRVPGHWKVAFKGAPVMGALEDKRRQAPSGAEEDAPCLTIDASVVMGGVEIKN
jgi:predicted membrane protein